jgi:transposase
MTDLEKENARLRKELRDAKMERDILKKGGSIFSKSDGKSTNL